MGGIEWVIHFSEFRGGSSGDFLHSQLAELRLQLVELLLEVVAVLVPQLAGLDFGGRHLFCLRASVVVLGRKISKSSNFRVWKLAERKRNPLSRKQTPGTVRA